jgi:hypothetical protein
MCLGGSCSVDFTKLQTSPLASDHKLHFRAPLLELLDVILRANKNLRVVVIEHDYVLVESS